MIHRIYLFRDLIYERTMLHDDHVYTHPECFMPERFFDKNGQLNNDDVSVAFGFGRRYVLPIILWSVVH